MNLYKVTRFEQSLLMMLVCLSLISFIGLLNLIMDLPMELLDILYPFGGFGMHLVLIDGNEIKWVEGVLAINHLEWGLIGGLTWGPITCKLNMGKKEVPSL